LSSHLRGVVAFDLDGTLLRGPTTCELLRARSWNRGRAEEALQLTGLCVGVVGPVVACETSGSSQCAGQVPPAADRPVRHTLVAGSGSFSALAGHSPIRWVARTASY
jgi:hypothetical protein